MMTKASTSSTLYKPQKSTFQFIIFKKSKPIYGKKKNRKKKRKEKEEETNPSFSSLDFKNKPISKAMNKKKKNQTNRWVPSSTWFSSSSSYLFASGFSLAWCSLAVAYGGQWVVSYVQWPVYSGHCLRERDLEEI
jgi:hypothetical protein